MHVGFIRPHRHLLWIHREEEAEQHGRISAGRKADELLSDSRESDLESHLRLDISRGASRSLCLRIGICFERFLRNSRKFDAVQHLRLQQLILPLISTVWTCADLRLSASVLRPAVDVIVSISRDAIQSKDSTFVESDLHHVGNHDCADCYVRF